MHRNSIRDYVLTPIGDPSILLSCFVKFTVRANVPYSGLRSLLLGKISGLEASHLGIGFAETLVALLEKGFQACDLFTKFKDGLLEIGDVTKSQKTLQIQTL